ncbi:hypothetical protein FA13DRAFT_1714686 [Coprinellus micaceus]|uniref:Uncharacterized protein n=1 Tax=Coprinellus micaceus TaxID=71717 RepID=A0A4Y7SR77_COPMI|nr:hypothetical protein FA13DRAFT_1714686 [Coprinellus micaceus]
MKANDASRPVRLVLTRSEIPSPSQQPTSLTRGVLTVGARSIPPLPTSKSPLALVLMKAPPGMFEAAFHACIASAKCIRETSQGLSNRPLNVLVERWKGIITWRRDFEDWDGRVHNLQVFPNSPCESLTPLAAYANNGNLTNAERMKRGLALKKPRFGGHPQRQDTSATPTSPADPEPTPEPLCTGHTGVIRAHAGNPSPGDPFLSKTMNAFGEYGTTSSLSGALTVTLCGDSGVFSIWGTNGHISDLPMFCSASPPPSPGGFAVICSSPCLAFGIPPPSCMVLPPLLCSTCSLYHPSLAHPRAGFHIGLTSSLSAHQTSGTASLRDGGGIWTIVVIRLVTGYPVENRELYPYHHIRDPNYQIYADDREPKGTDQTAWHAEVAIQHITNRTCPGTGPMLNRETKR